MKKSLIALAVLGASGFAMAQSTVTLYGVADAGLARAQTYVGGPGTGAGTLAAWALGADKTSRTGMSSADTMNNGNSRLGVRGVEDLGGGLKAGFNFESGLSLKDGEAKGSGGGFWGRAANMYVGGGWGTFLMGRTLNPSFFALATYELTGTANYSVIGNTYSFTGIGPRSSSLFQYKTPNFGGFSGTLGYVFKDDNSGNAKWDANLIYANGPIAASLGVNKTKDQPTNFALGGKYNFGQFVVAASYHNIGVDAAGAEYRRRGFAIGGTANFGPASVTLDLTRDTKNEVTGVYGHKFTNVLLEGKYSLSKRTFAYAAYLKLDGTNNYGVGLRHNF